MNSRWRLLHLGKMKAVLGVILMSMLTVGSGIPDVNKPESGSDPKNLSLLQEALMHAGVSSAGITLICIITKREKNRTIYRASYTNKQGQRCSMEWQVIYGRAILTPKKPTCENVKNDNGIDKATKRNTGRAFGAPDVIVGSPEFVGQEGILGPPIYMGQPGVAVGQPGIVVGQPGVAVGQPGFVVEQPGVVVGQPGVVVEQPGVVVRQPGVIVGQPGVAGTPYIVGQPNVIVPQPGIVGPKPGIVVPQPGIIRTPHIAPPQPAPARPSYRPQYRPGVYQPTYRPQYRPPYLPSHTPPPGYKLCLIGKPCDEEVPYVPPPGYKLCPTRKNG